MNNKEMIGLTITGIAFVVVMKLMVGA